MNEPWLALFLIFVCLFLAGRFAVASASVLVFGNRRVAQRFEALLPLREGEGELERLRKRAAPHAGSAPTARLRRLLLQSGTRLTLPRLGALFAVLWVVLLVVLPGSLGLAFRLTIGGAVSGILLIGYLRLKRSRRIARFGEQLPEVIDVIVRSLRAGHPLPVSLALVAREMPSPAGPEFTLVVDEVNYGRSLAEALERMRERVGYQELQFFVAAVSIAHQTGGNLGEILSRLARMLRERFRVIRRARALSAEGRFSGLALSALPLILFAVINVVSPAYYADFWTNPAAATIVAISLALLLLGNLTIYKLVHFKV